MTHYISVIQLLSVFYFFFFMLKLSVFTVNIPQVEKW